jgi:Holliday junction DNA helicase RuvB
MIETDRLISPEADLQEDRFDRAIRPLSLEDYVGQQAVREQMEIFIGAARKREEPLDHTLVLAPLVWAKLLWLTSLPMKWVLV